MYNQIVEKMRCNKGITIIALVITIIVLLILAGISIAEFTGSGLFAQAQKAKLEAKRSTITEWLSLKLIEEQANNPTGTAEEIIKATRENVIQHQEELLAKGKEVEIEEIKDEENWEKAEVYFYVVVDEDVYKVDLEGAKFIGNREEFAPIIRITGITNTTSTITVTVETQRNEGGKIEYWIKAEDEEEYELKETKDEETYTYEGLIQNKKYNIKIVAVAKNKKTAEVLVDRETGKITDLTTANTTFSYNPEGWTNGSVIATASTTATGYTLQTSKDGITWTSTASQTFTANGTIYARLYDGTNYGGTASGNVTNIDKTKPIVTGATSTTNSIKITATDEASGIIGYAVTTSTTAPTSFTSCTSTKSLSTTVTGKTQGTTYYVWVKDAAGNVSTSKSTATGTVTPGTTTGAITFSTPTWSNGKASTTISTNTSYTIQYQVNSTTGTWTTGTNVTGRSHGDIVYARLWDGTNGGAYTTLNILDETASTNPSITVVRGTAGNNNYYTSDVVVKITAGSDSQSGVNKTTYTLSGATSKGETTISNGGTITISNDGNTTITVYTYDNAGNKSSSAQTIKKDTTGPDFGEITYSEVSGGYAYIRIQATDNIGIDINKTKQNIEATGNITAAIESESSLRYYF